MGTSPGGHHRGAHPVRCRASDEAVGAAEEGGGLGKKVKSLSSFAVALALLVAIHSAPLAEVAAAWFKSLGALALGAGLAAKGYSRGSLDKSGAIAAVFVGWGTLYSGMRFGLALGVFFFASSAITRLRPDIKAKVEEDYKVGGGRNWVQVFANGGVPTLLALAYAFVSHGAELPLAAMMGTSSGTFAAAGALSAPMLAGALALAFVGYYSCCGGDTWASELGVLSKTHPRLVTAPWRVVTPGTNGGVTPLGFAASAAGGLAVGWAFYVGSFLCAVFCASNPAAASFYLWAEQWPILLVGGACGLVGSLIDSLLGATIQFSGYCSQRERVVSTPGPTVTHISGLPFLSNSMVNLVSALITAALTAYAYVLVYTHAAATAL